MNGGLQASDAIPTPHAPTSDAAADPGTVPTAAGMAEAQDDRLQKITPQQPVRVTSVAKDCALWPLLLVRHVTASHNNSLFAAAVSLCSWSNVVLRPYLLRNSRQQLTLSDI